MSVLAAAPSQDASTVYVPGRSSQPLTWRCSVARASLSLTGTAGTAKVVDTALPSLPVRVSFNSDLSRALSELGTAEAVEQLQVGRDVEAVVNCSDDVGG